jgi:hypothetical protein
MDTVSLSQATFILALAKNNVRQCILANFLYLVQTELPGAEYDQRRMTGMLKKSRDISAFRRLIRIPGLPHNPDPKLAPYSKAEARKFCKKACELYKFRNFVTFFTADVASADAMTPVQRQFIRLAQIFKSQMIAEIELKQRIVERALIQDFGSDEAERQVAREQHAAATKTLRETHTAQLKQSGRVGLRIRQTLLNELEKLWKSNLKTQSGLAKIKAQDLIRLLGPKEFETIVKDSPGKSKSTIVTTKLNGMHFRIKLTFSFNGQKVVKEKRDLTAQRYSHDRRVADLQWLRERCDAEEDKNTLYQRGMRVEVEIFDENDIVVANDLGDRVLLSFLTDLQKLAEAKLDAFKGYRLTEYNDNLLKLELCYIGRLRKLIPKMNRLDCDDLLLDTIAKASKVIFYFEQISNAVLLEGEQVEAKIGELLVLIQQGQFEGNDAVDSLNKVDQSYNELKAGVRAKVKGEFGVRVRAMFRLIDQDLIDLRESVLKSLAARVDERNARVDLDHKKLLDYLIDEKEEKFIELVEGTRSHIAHIDNYLKRLAIALEDDFKVQFYDPAFAGVRAEGRDKSVSFGQIERTTILTNNRTFAKVSPQATMEFDLPRRAPVIVEAMAGAKAIMQDYGSLVNDSTFMGITAALSGTPAVGGPGNGSGPAVRPLFPTLGTDRQSSFLSGGPPGIPGGRQKTALEQLIPDPSVYKIQTGTGFEIRPVIQPDGHSLMYDFNYLYTTNVREPVDPDEKHLGRIKQHYIHTQVQTSSFELREISRYQVALKVSRTSRGVPFLEEIPIAGWLFRPAPSAESSLQQNIILGQTTVYPTLFDLMGLRWSRHVADLDHRNLRDLEHVVRGRNKSINDYVFDRASSQVDKFLDIEHRDKGHFRPDLYHQQTRPSPYHPNGYIYPDAGRDPTGRNDLRRDRRPEEFRNQQYDELRGGPVEHYQHGTERIDEYSPLDIPQIETPQGPETINDSSPTFQSQGPPGRINRRIQLPKPQIRGAALPLRVRAKSAIRLINFMRTAPAPQSKPLDYLPQQQRTESYITPVSKKEPAKRSLLQRVFRRG